MIRIIDCTNCSCTFVFTHTICTLGSFHGLCQLLSKYGLVSFYQKTIENFSHLFGLLGQCLWHDYTVRDTDRDTAGRQPFITRNPTAQANDNDNNNSYDNYLLFHNRGLLRPPVSHHTVCSVIAVYNLAPVKPDDWNVSSLLVSRLHVPRRTQRWPQSWNKRVSTRSKDYYASLDSHNTLWTAMKRIHKRGQMATRRIQEIWSRCRSAMPRYTASAQQVRCGQQAVVAASHLPCLQATRQLACEH